jgi:hypothetical protein
MKNDNFFSFFLFLCLDKMNCSQYKSLGNYFNIMMPSKKEELNKPMVSEGYTKANPSTVEEQPEFKNRFFQDEYKKNYVYGVSSTEKEQK